MKFINKNLRNLMLGVGIAIAPSLSYATSISKGLPGVADKVQMLVDTLCGPMAFLMSCGGLLIAAGTWKFAGHIAGMKIASGVVAAMIIICNIVAWVSYFSGATI